MIRSPPSTESPRFLSFSLIPSTSRCARFTGCNIPRSPLLLALVWRGLGSCLTSACSSVLNGAWVGHSLPPLFCVCRSRWVTESPTAVLCLPEPVGNGVWDPVDQCRVSLCHSHSHSHSPVYTRFTRCNVRIPEVFVGLPPLNDDAFSSEVSSTRVDRFRSSWMVA